MIDYYAPNLDLTLLGCGFLGFYHLGAIYLLRQIWPHRPYNRICGSSCGGLVAALLLSGLKLELVLRSSMRVIKQLRGVFRNPIKLSSVASISELVERLLEKLLPSNAHELCTNKLGLSLTKVGWPLENRFMSQFETRRQLIEAICAGCFIPIWSGALLAPQMDGVHFIDGAYTDNSPTFHDSLHSCSMGSSANVLGAAGARPFWVGISPLASEVEVSPKGEGCLFRATIMSTVYKANWPNVARFWHAMFPFPVATYKPYLINGHSDMKEFLFRKKLIKCRECYETKCDGRKVDIDSNSNSKRKQAACIACLRLLERVDSLRMSDHLLHMLDRE